MISNNILNIYKPKGLTPLEVLKILKEQSNSPYLKDQKLAYAGRLDPMAEGLMLVLVGEECKQREKYQDLSKVYEFEAIFGLSSDTYDCLGLIKKQNFEYDSIKVLESLKKILSNYVGLFEQEYPIYSSKTVNGKKLFELAKENKLANIEIPKKTVNIQRLELLESDSIKLTDLVEDAIYWAKTVKGDFRQQEIISEWLKLLEENDKNQLLLKCKFEAEVSSGTYVRGLVSHFGETLKTGALTFNIFRTKVGQFKVEDSIRIIA